MPRQPKPAALYNHDERPFIATSWAADGQNGQTSFVSQNVHLPPRPPDEYDDADYTMPVDEDPDQPYEPLSEQDTLSGGLPGIQVLPKLRAKRYLNSVCFCPSHLNPRLTLIAIGCPARYFHGVP